MDAKYVSPFSEALCEVLSGFGVQGVRRGGISLKKNLEVGEEVTAIIGLTGGVRGNVACGMSEDAARKLVSCMMMGMPVQGLDEMAQSALAELLNMVSGQAGRKLPSEGGVIDLSPPTLIMGKNVAMRLSAVPALAVEILMEGGRLELNVAIEG